MTINKEFGRSRAQIARGFPPAAARAEFLAGLEIPFVQMPVLILPSKDVEATARGVRTMVEAFRPIFARQTPARETMLASSFIIEIGDDEEFEIEEFGFEPEEEVTNVVGAITHRANQCARRPSHCGRQICLTLGLSQITYLLAGYQLVRAAFRSDQKTMWSKATLGEGGVPEFGGEPPANARALLLKLCEIYNCAFDVVFVVEREDCRVFDVYVSKDARRRNMEALSNEPPKQLEASLSGLPYWEESVRTSAPRPDSIIAYGDCVGHRQADGLAALSIESAMKLSRDGKAVVLLSETLTPANSEVLAHLSGLVLPSAGPASHIAVMARAMGVAVLTHTGGLKLTPQYGRNGAHTITEGDVLHVNETWGCLCMGTGETSKGERQCIISPRSASEVFKRVFVTKSHVATNEPHCEVAGVGLCRSEMHLYGSNAFPAFQDHVRAAIDGRKEPVALEVIERLADQLERLLAHANGRTVNYRLADASAVEVLGAGNKLVAGGGAELIGLMHGVRGPRWALRSGFYEQQIGLIATTIQRVRGRVDIDLIVTVPSAFSIEEVVASRNLFDRQAISAARTRARFGVMLECARMCALVDQMVETVDAFSIGLNDLAQSVYGLDRGAWPFLRDYYLAKGLTQRDLFSEIDTDVVLPLVSNAVSSIVSHAPSTPVFLCGSAATDPLLLKRFAGEGNVHFSVDEDRFDEVGLCLARMLFERESPGFGLHAEMILRGGRMARIGAAKKCGEIGLAQRMALEWIIPSLRTRSLPELQNWKRCKKDLTAAFFGALEGRYFDISESNSAADYVLSLLERGTTPRVSIFPNQISCHSSSRAFGPGTIFADLQTFLADAAPPCQINVFPQQSTEQLCFRMALGDGGAIIEAGWGQAMYVFENERGQHETILVRLKPGSEPEFLSQPAKDERINEAMSALLRYWLDWLDGVQMWMPEWLSAPEASLEGYFGADYSKRPVIVDIDLPADIAWN